MDKASNYFLLTEMLRGMYVVMEQFFRPPYVTSTPELKVESLEPVY
jgi:NADH dehydrogenase (ubiquinone) Fe-S protein 8